MLRDVFTIPQYEEISTLTYCKIKARNLNMFVCKLLPTKLLNGKYCLKNDNNFVQCLYSENILVCFYYLFIALTYRVLHYINNFNINTYNMELSLIIIIKDPITCHQRRHTVTVTDCGNLCNVLQLQLQLVWRNIKSSHASALLVAVVSWCKIYKSDNLIYHCTLSCCRVGLL